MLNLDLPVIAFQTCLQLQTCKPVIHLGVINMCILSACVHDDALCPQHRTLISSHQHSLVAKELATSLAPIPHAAMKEVKEPMTSSHT